MDHLRGGIGDEAKRLNFRFLVCQITHSCAIRFESATRQHQGIHQDMPSREKAVEKLQLQSRILESDQCIDLRLSDQFFHAMLIGIRLDTYVGIGRGDSH